MRARITDVAKMAGVSPATVSLVMNGKDSAISEKTRVRVLECAHALRYHSTRVYASAMRESSRTIGLLFSNLEETFMAELAGELSRAAFEKDYYALLYGAGVEGPRMLEALQALAQRGMDGVVVAQPGVLSPEDRVALLRAADQIQIPVVIVNSEEEQDPLPFVNVDQEKIAYLATRHLLEKGHSRILCAATSSVACCAARRLEGYRRALKERGVSFQEELVCTADEERKAGELAVRAAMEQRATAIVCLTDGIAAGVYREAGRVGLSIPEELSVTGAGDTALCELLQPALTSVSLSKGKLAQESVELLMKLMDEPEKVQEPVPALSPSLLLRDSVAAPCAR